MELKLPTHVCTILCCSLLIVLNGIETVERGNLIHKIYLLIVLNGIETTED